MKPWIDKHTLTAREMGTLAGLAGVWRPNPYTSASRKAREWSDGFGFGLTVRVATLERENA